MRSGKTLCTGLSFFCWAMSSFHNKKFALCGKTIASVKRNLLDEVLPLLQKMGFRCQMKVSQNLLLVRFGGRQNTFCLFGGKDEAAASFIQGITLAGVLLDEAALMPRSFVEQAIARCSVPQNRLWFSCNPQSPAHWFFQEWVAQAQEKQVLRLHFSMDDNPALSQQTKEQYQKMFQGPFYQRYVLGQWVAAEGLVYDFFNESFLQPPPDGPFQQWYVSVDYGTVNPTSMGLWGLRNDTWFRVDEFYYDSKVHRKQKTDEEYADALLQLAGGRKLRAVIVDPSAASFIACLRQRQLRVIRAKNQVLSGIRLTAQLLKQRKLVICSNCSDAIREFSLYRWDLQTPSQDQVRKEFDHAMDEIRYFAATIAANPNQTTFCARYAERTGSC